MSHRGTGSKRGRPEDRHFTARGHDRPERDDRGRQHGPPEDDEWQPKSGGYEVGARKDAYSRQAGRKYEPEDLGRPREYEGRDKVSANYQRPEGKPQHDDSRGKDTRPRRDNHGYDREDSYG